MFKLVRVEWDDNVLRVLKGLLIPWQDAELGGEEARMVWRFFEMTNN
jgi:hypothetical protein